MSIEDKILNKYGSTRKIFETLKHPEEIGISKLYKQDMNFFVTHFDNIADLYEQLSYGCIHFNEYEYGYCYFFYGILTSISENDYWSLIESYQDAVIAQYIHENL